MNLKTLSTETSYVSDFVAPRMSIEDKSTLLNLYKKSPRKRHRFCFHQSPSVDLHDIVICYDKNTYIPPNKHIGKSESILVLQGSLEFYIFSESGQVVEFYELGDAGTGLPFYIKVPPNTWHGLRAKGDTPCIIKETISGPYEGNSLRWASFAPSENENNNSEGFDWYENLAKDEKIEFFRKNIENFSKINDVVFRSERSVVSLQMSQLDPIIEAAKISQLKRARLCCHSASEDRLQEMFIVLCKGVDIEESVHIKKDESLTVVNGSGHYDFPNEDASLRESIKLSEYQNTNGCFFTRINRFVPHKIIVDSDYLIIHEATTGPFKREDTSYRIESES